MSTIEFIVYKDIDTKKTYINKNIAEKFNIHAISKKTIQETEYIEATLKDITSIIYQTKNTSEPYQPIYKFFKQNPVKLRLNTNNKNTSVIKDNTELFVNRTLYEKAKKENIEIEGKPKVIENKNYYSITKEQLDILNKKQDNKKTIITYNDKINNKYYQKEEDIENKQGNPKNIMGHTCYEISKEKLDKQNKKIITVSVYLKQNKTLNINITSLNNNIYIEDKYTKEKQNKQQIRIDGALYTQVNELELANIKKELTKEGNEVIFKQRKIVKKNKELNDMFNNKQEENETKKNK